MRKGVRVGVRWEYEPLEVPEGVSFEDIGCLWWELLVSLEMELEEQMKS